MNAGEAKSAERCPICGAAARSVRRVVRAGMVAVCSKCGSWYRTPRPRTDELACLYDQSYYDSWGENQDTETALHSKQAVLAPLLEKLDEGLDRDAASTGRRMLDVGSATGTLPRLAHEAGWDVFATEINPYAVERLRERCGDDHVFFGDLCECTFENESFDILTMTDVIEHLLNLHGALRRAYELLRPGGRIVVTTPRADSLSRRLMRKNWLHFKAEHIQYFSGKAMRTCMQQHGFRDVTIRPHVKRLPIEYLYRQLNTYSHWLLSPLLAVLRAGLPRRLRGKPLPFLCGEMLVIARK